MPAAPIAFIDTETEWHTFVTNDLSTADPYGLRVGRFYERHPVGRALAGEMVPDTTALLSETAHRVAALTHGTHLVGAVPNFDAELLDRLLRDQGLIPAWHYHLIDVENLAVGYLAGQGHVFIPPWSSESLTEALGVTASTEDERHTAMGDARWAQRIYDHVMEEAR